MSWKFAAHDLALRVTALQCLTRDGDGGYIEEVESWAQFIKLTSGDLPT